MADNVIHIPHGLPKREVERSIARAARGAKLLDEKQPGWWKRINQPMLDMSNASRCIMGQAWMPHNGFTHRGWSGISDLFGEDPHKGAVKYGFTISDTALNTYIEEKKVWDLLASAWIYEIRERRAAAERAAKQQQPVTA